jgi:putative RecB family exonuclease
MPTYSHSRLSTFEQCPLSFKFAYIENLKPDIPETVETFLGSRVHDALEHLYKQLRFTILLTKEELIEFYNAEWKKNWNDDILVVRDNLEPENFRKMGEQYLTDYYNRHHPFDESKTIGLETLNTVELAEGYDIHVRIDRLSVKDDVYEVHDYKTSGRLPTQKDVDNDRQLAIYAYGVRRMYPDARKVKLVWHYLAFDKELVSYRTDEQLKQLQKDIMALIKRVEATTDFRARKSALCSWCGYKRQCPMFKHEFKVEELEPNEYLKEDGVQLVNEYAKFYEKKQDVDEKLEKIKEALLAYAKKEGVQVVNGSDVKASISSYPRLSFPKKNEPAREAFVETVRKIGLFDQLSTVDVYELAKLINRGELNAELGKLLDPFIQKSESINVRLSRK